jgi:hypothetical protein
VLNFGIPCRAVWRKVADSFARHCEGEPVAFSLIGYVGENTGAIDDGAVGPVNGYHLLRIMIECKDAQGNAIIKDSNAGPNYSRLAAERSPGQTGARRHPEGVGDSLPL